MIGMSRTTGRRITDDAPSFDHLQQSLRDLFSTLIGTRICRRSYGSLIPHVIDQPCNEATRLKLMSAAATAVIRWESRIRISQIQVQQGEQAGQWLLTTAGQIIDQTGREAPFQYEFLLGAAA